MSVAPDRRRYTWKRFVRENWYRDAWLVAITLFVVLWVVIGVGQNSARISDIQESRRFSLAVSCAEQNERHDGAIMAVRRLSRQGSIRDTATVIVLIQALVPRVNDCIRRAEKLTKTPPTTSPPEE